jgi:hypothetical protein
MEQKIDWDLEYISGVLSDIETINLPWSELERVSIRFDWDTALGRLRRLNPNVFTDKQAAEFASIKRRLSIQKAKIQTLGFLYPMPD